MSGLSDNPSGFAPADLQDPAAPGPEPEGDRTPPLQTPEKFVEAMSRLAPTVGVNMANELSGCAEMQENGSVCLTLQEPFDFGNTSPERISRVIVCRPKLKTREGLDLLLSTQVPTSKNLEAVVAACCPQFSKAGIDAGWLGEMAGDDAYRVWMIAQGFFPKCRTLPRKWKSPAG